MVWFAGLDSPTLFSLSYYRILSFPTCRHFFFLPKCGSFHIRRKGHDEVRNYQFPPPTILSLTGIWYWVLEMETAYREIQQAVPHLYIKAELCSAPSVLAVFCVAVPARKGGGRSVCRIDHHEPICSIGFR